MKSRFLLGKPATKSRYRDEAVVGWRVNANIGWVRGWTVENEIKVARLVHMHTILLSLFGKQPTFSSLPSNNLLFFFFFLPLESWNENSKWRDNHYKDVVFVVDSWHCKIRVWYIFKNNGLEWESFLMEFFLRKSKAKKEAFKGKFCFGENVCKKNLDVILSPGKKEKKFVNS